MEDPDNAEPLPAYTYFPGCPWPHPHHSGTGNLKNPSNRSQAAPRPRKTVVVDSVPARSQALQRWILLGSTRGLGRALARRGPARSDRRAAQSTDQARRGRRQGSRAARRGRSHSLPSRRAVVRRRGRAGGSASTRAGPRTLGPALPNELAENPPTDHGPAGAPVTRVFDFQIEPESTGATSEGLPGSTQARHADPGTSANPLRMAAPALPGE